MNRAPCPYSKSGFQGLCASLRYKFTRVRDSTDTRAHSGPRFALPHHPRPRLRRSVPHTQVLLTVTAVDLGTLDTK